MHRVLALAIATVAVACAKSETYESGGNVDSTADSTRISVPDIDIGMKKDTVTVPTIGTEKDTVVITKPVTGKKQIEVSRPTVTIHKKP